nr:HNH endonuclease [Actinomycetota bacterium]
MASWVITMSKDYPQHWEIAKQHGFWDMTSTWQIDAGDDVYFWQAGGGSFLGRTRATSDVRQLTPSDQPPWEDSGEREYVARFTFDLLSDAP